MILLLLLVMGFGSHIGGHLAMDRCEGVGGAPSQREACRSSAGMAEGQDRTRHATRFTVDFTGYRTPPGQEAGR